MVTLLLEMLYKFSSLPSDAVCLSCSLTLQLLLVASSDQQALRKVGLERSQQVLSSLWLMVRSAGVFGAAPRLFLGVRGCLTTTSFYAN